MALLQYLACFLTLVAIVLIAWGFRGRRVLLLNRCPGKRFRKCTYDLSALPFDPDGTIVCPECGHSWTRTDQQRRIRYPRYRVIVCAILLAIGTSASLLAPMMRTGRWQTLLPTDLLIVLLPDQFPYGSPWHWEMLSRVQSAQLSPAQHQRLLRWAKRSLSDSPAGTWNGSATILSGMPDAVMMIDLMEERLWQDGMTKDEALDIVMFFAMLEGYNGLSPLVRALEHPYSAVRELAITVLGDWGPRAEEALPSLRVLLDDDDPAIRSMTQSAIERIAP